MFQRPSACLISCLAGLHFSGAAHAALVRAAGDGAFLLHARDAVTHGSMLRYEPQTNKNCLGYWVNVEDWAEWSFHVEKTGGFAVELWQGCGQGQGGSEVAVAVGGTNFQFVVQDTGHFQNFVPRRLGEVSFSKPGDYSLAVRPQRKQAAAVMDIRQVRLVPVAARSDTNESLQAVLHARRIVFLGDSITYAGEYMDFVETWLRLRFPNAAVDLLDLGLPSETVSGLTEPGHAGGAFPRPDLRERLGRVLEKAKPDLLFACYGMNDGIYCPFSEEKFNAFQTGIRRLREQAGAAGANVVHLTPPTFDPVPLKGRTLPAGLPEYRRPFEGYNETLDKYSAWLVSQRAQGWEVIDVHQPMNQFLARRREADPAFKLAGDGVHANTQGHWLIARELLKTWGAVPAVTGADTPAALLESHPRAAEILKLVQQRNRLRKDSWLTATGHTRPGMAKGKPLAEAEAESAQLDARIREISASQ